MSLTRKMTSAARLLRNRGVADVTSLARVRASEFLLAHRRIPSDPGRLAGLLAETLNRWSGFSRIAISPDDLAGCSAALLGAYLRHRFPEMQAVDRPGPLRPLEAVVLADGLWSEWRFRDVDEAVPAWAEAVAGTGFERRIDQVRRRAALRLGRLGEAARGLEGPGDDMGALMLRGDVFDALDRVPEARAAYEEAIRRDGADPSARLAHAFHLMKAGRVRDGLASWSASDALSGVYPLRRHRPHWRGEPLGRRRLMVLFEHGLGDMIQVARFLPALLAREPEATVMGRLPPPLLGLMARQFPRIHFIVEEQREPDYDFFVPSMQLASVLDVPDLAPLSRYIDLGPPSPRGGRLRVGVCWRGHPRQYEFTRSIPIDLFATLFADRGADFVVLLNRLTPAEEARIADEPNVTTPPIHDFLDLASEVAACDLVVSVDTAVVHLAGAGGARTILLSRPDSCWRWGTAGAAGPWYDTVEVLRHGGDMDWPRLIAACAARIGARHRDPAAA